ncbi:LacI family DNA-binding transcriptional regulator [Victivallis sp. Marseille-Q1083]|uniref:LacI family DNA-binding transcriptional regulator n=1 Tax=Victivallis sp. Marseille-Q1083 TaxID=2717288 RepID=UPI00158B40F0|nr:LacI family DNA-binding transcriptional regulator [Victivallis sp. Marseille-Q1083]
MKASKSKGVSIEMIAAECGLSAMTVSRALRQQVSVAEKTREKVYDAAARLGYLRLSRAGRKQNEPEAQHRRLIQLIVSTQQGSMARFHSEVIALLVQDLAMHGFECIIRTTDCNYTNFLRLIETAKNADVERTVIIGSFSDAERRALLVALPNSLLLDDSGRDVLEAAYSSFAFDNTCAAALAVQHLLKNDRQRIALITGPAEHYFSREIEFGYRDTLETAGFEPDDQLILYTDFTAEGAQAAVNTLLNRQIPFDAIFTNDEMAAGVYRALYEHNLRIPDQISVCGCDGLPLGEQLYPRLTTVMLDYRQLAKQAVECILNSNVNPMKIRLIPSLLVRES